ncbi:MAG: SprB repeat-containing protein, partial [Bacteroidota bacterium]|nr:SprB repeat-containing protein [Bacteroidota bacterium]
TGNLIVADSITDILCYGDCNGAIDLTVTGGNTPYSYFWSNSETSEDISGLCAGSYFVNVFESGSTQPGNAWPWSYTNTGANHTILIPPGSISLNGSPPPIGSIIGVFYDDAGVLKCGGYTVWTGLQSAISAWADDTSTPDKDGFSSGEAFNWQIYANGVSYIMSAQYNSGFPNMGNYITNGMSGVLSLNSAAGGFNSFSYTVLQADEIIVNANISPVNPGIGNNGAIDLTISGGTPPYVFLWSNSATSEDLSALNIGTYILSLTDANQCTIVDTFEVSTQVVGALAASAAIGNTFCYGDCNGEIDLSVSGGISPYEYIWSTGETTGFIDSLCAGNYSVTINDQITASFPTMPWTYTNTGINHTILIQTGVVTIDGDSIQIGDYVGVFYDDNGTLECGGYSVWTSSLSIAVSAWGDDSSTSFKDGFDPGESFNWKVWRQADSAIIDMTPTYLTVMPNQGNFTTNGMSGLEILTGSSNNSLIENYVVTQPDSIIFNPIIEHVNPINGFNGAIDISVMGGTSSYNYNWSNGQSSEDVIALSPGNYSVTITDANSCTAVNNFIVELLSNSPLSAIGAVTDVDCSYNCNGDIDLTVSGGNTPYYYLWSNGDTTEDIVDVCGGMYWVIISDGQITFNPGWPWNYSLTDTIHSVSIPSATSIIINGATAPIGTYIGAFYDNNGILECGGYAALTGSSSSILIYGDDPNTTTKDGFENNEELIWKIWLNGTSYNLIPDYNINYSQQGNFIANGLSSVNSFLSEGKLDLSFNLIQPSS